MAIKPHCQVDVPSMLHQVSNSEDGEAIKKARLEQPGFLVLLSAQFYATVTLQTLNLLGSLFVKRRFDI